MPDTCAVNGCLNRRGRDEVSFYNLPKVRVQHRCPATWERDQRRRLAWIRALRRPNDGKQWKVCSNHFISGAPANPKHDEHPDWIPNQNLGYLSTHSPKRSLLRQKRAEAKELAPKIPAKDEVDDMESYDGLNELKYIEIDLASTKDIIRATQFQATVKSEEYESYSQQPKLNDTCRLCLTENIEHTVSIFPSSMIYDNRTTVAQSIEKLTDIQIDEFDGLPPNICSNCYEALNFVHKFQQKSIESISQLQSMNLQNDPKLIEIVIEKNADAHPEFVDVTDAGNGTNKIQKFKDYSEFEMLSHDKTAEKLVKENQNWNGRTLCTICGALIQNARLETHINKHLGVEPYKCSDCHKSFASRAYLSCHYRDMHTGNKYECNICGVKQSRKAAIRVHMKYHFEPTHPCPVCGKKFRFKHQIRKHMMVHTGERPISCELCPKACRNKYQLHVHMRVHTKDKPYKCFECGNNFTYNYQLKVHKDRHHPEQNLEMDNCPISFNYKEFLTEIPETEVLSEVQEVEY